MNLCPKAGKSMISAALRISFFGNLGIGRNLGSCCISRWVPKQRLLIPDDGTGKPGGFCRTFAHERNAFGKVGHHRPRSKGVVQIKGLARHHKFPEFYMKVLVRCVLNGEDRDVWKMADDAEARLLMLIRSGNIAPKGAENIVEFSDVVLDELLTGNSILPKPKLLILMFAIMLYPSKFSSPKVKALDLLFVHDKFERFSAAETALICNNVALIKCSLTFSLNVSWLFETLYVLLSSPKADIEHASFSDHQDVMVCVNAILKLLKHVENIPSRYFVTLMKIWNSLDLNTCSLKRLGSVWSLLSNLFKRITSGDCSTQFALDMKEFLEIACQVDATSEKLNRGNDSSSAFDKTKYFIRTKDIDRCLGYLRDSRDRLKVLELNGDHGVHFFDTLTRYLALNFKEFIDHPDTLMNILNSMTIAGYYPRLLIEKVTNDVFVEHYLERGFDPHEVIFLNNGLKIERPDYPQFSVEAVQKAYELAPTADGFRMQPVKEINEIVDVVQRVLRCAPTRLIIRSKSYMFPFHEIIVPFKHGQVCDVPPDVITDGFVGSRLPEGVKLVVITVFNTRTKKAGPDSGYYVAKERMLEKQGILTFEMDARDLENGGRRLSQFIKDNKDGLF